MGERGGGRKQTTVDTKLIKAFEDAGYPPEEIARLKARALHEEPDEFRIVVEPENCDAVRLFRQMQTQWRVEAVSFVSGKRSHVLFARTGLDYGALAPIAAALRIETREATMDGLRVLEAESLAIHIRRQEEQLRRS